MLWFIKSELILSVRLYGTTTPFFGATASMAIRNGVGMRGIWIRIVLDLGSCTGGAAATMDAEEESAGAGA